MYSTIFSAKFLLFFFTINISRSFTEINESIFNTTFLRAVKPLRNPSQCSRSISKCLPVINSSVCLDIYLPYKSTAALIQTDDLNQYIEIVELTTDYLEKWNGLRYVPQCWKAIQILLCATFFPKCDNETSQIYLLSNDFCEQIREPCGVVEKYFEWPDFLDCNNRTLFPENCANLYSDMKIMNTIKTNRCNYPLVYTDDRKIWFKNFDGCALHCINPIYNEQQHRNFISIVSYGVSISIVFSSFALITIVINKASLKRRFYTLIIFYMNLCILIASFGWGLQFIKGKNELVCHHDNTTRYSEPSRSEHFFCILSFYLIYYFSFAAMIWFSHLFRVFHQTFHNLTVGIKTEFNRHKYHITAWSTPLIGSIFILLFGEIDGDSIRGICFIGSNTPTVKFFFFSIPMAFCLSIGVFHAIKTISLLYKAKTTLKISVRHRTNITKALIRITFYIVSVCILFIMIILIMIFEDSDLERMHESLRDHLACNLGLTPILSLKNQTKTDPNKTNEIQRYLREDHTCKEFESPSTILINVQMIAVFLIHILASTWVWTSATQKIWKHFLNTYFENDDVQPYLLNAIDSTMKSNDFRNNKLKNFNLKTSKSTMIISYHDPVDMDLISMHSVSSTLQQNIQELIDCSKAIDEDKILMNKTNSRNETNLIENKNLSLTKTFRSSESNGSIAYQQQQRTTRNNLESSRQPKRKNKKLRTKTLHNFDDDTSDGSSISIDPKFRLNLSANRREKCTKATSTGDLLGMFYATRMMTPFMNISNAMVGYNGIGVNNGIIHSKLDQIQSKQKWTQSQAHEAQFSTLNLFPPKSQAKNKPIMLDQNGYGGKNSSNSNHRSISNLGFTHGMSGQVEHKMDNPLGEKRKPISVMNGTSSRQSKPNNIVTNSHIKRSMMMVVDNFDHTITPNEKAMQRQIYQDCVMNSFQNNHFISSMTDNIQQINSNLKFNSNLSSTIANKNHKNIDNGDENQKFCHNLGNFNLNPKTELNSGQPTDPMSNLQCNTFSTNFVAPSNSVIPSVQMYLSNPTALANPSLAPIHLNSSFLNANQMNSIESSRFMNPFAYLNNFNVSNSSNSLDTITNNPLSTQFFNAMNVFGGGNPYVLANNNHIPSIFRYYNTQAAFSAFQQSKNQEEIDSFMKEHEKYKSLITAHVSDNESNSELLSICLSESDTSRIGYYSDSAEQQFNLGRTAVEERFRKVEDCVNNHQSSSKTINDGRDQK
ncbi:Smoothened -like protein [Sarcoptes scabiei]|uniref:Smoothened -like protein n=1 Tax=Sarcoptes scabiei TaxID=52283 RepID=A0A834VFS1_SARSC|nr:Smoothened -like protein [Sarcoptes scabiei]